MTAPAIVPVARLTAPGRIAHGSQFFECTRLHCVLTARSCVARQLAAQRPASAAGDAPQLGGAAPHQRCVSCKRCDVGAAVRERLERLEGTE